MISYFTLIWLLAVVYEMVFETNWTLVTILYISSARIIELPSSVSLSVSFLL